MKIQKHLLEMASRTMKKIRKLDADIGITSGVSLSLAAIKHDRRLRNRYYLR